MQAPHPHTTHALFATGLWTVSLTMLIGATVWPIHAVHPWAIFVAIVAAVFTGWRIVEHVVEREHQQTAVRVSAAVARAIADNRVDRI